MTITIELPESRTPRTHVAARVASEYVAFELGKLTAEAWPRMMAEGSLQGQVAAAFVGVVKWTVTADEPFVPDTTPVRNTFAKPFDMAGMVSAILTNTVPKP